jgi:hypothetical protein
MPRTCGGDGIPMRLRSAVAAAHASMPEDWYYEGYKAALMAARDQYPLGIQAALDLDRIWRAAGKERSPGGVCGAGSSTGGVCTCSGHSGCKAEAACIMRRMVRQLLDALGQCLGQPRPLLGPLPAKCMPYSASALVGLQHISRDPGGYLLMTVAQVGSVKARMRAHQLLCWAARGPPPNAAMHVLHRCNHPRCLNPSHFEWGTAADNAKDGRCPPSLCKCG